VTFERFTPSGHRCAILRHPAGKNTASRPLEAYVS
jgi:hypothetical protein